LACLWIPAFAGMTMKANDAGRGGLHFNSERVDSTNPIAEQGCVDTAFH